MHRLAYIVAALALMAAPHAARAEEPFTDATYAEALRLAQADGKPIMIDFYTTWCAPCKEFDRTTWKDSAVRKFIADNMIALKVDAESEAGVPLARQFSIRAYPTLLFVDADGRQIGRLMGFRDAVKFIETTAQVLQIQAPEIDVLTRKRELAHRRGAHGRATFAKELVAMERYEEAMGEYMWCLENGGEDGTFTVIRNSSLIDEVATLASLYPPMASGVRSYAEGLRQDLVGGRGDWGDANLLLRLFENLPADDSGARLIEVFDAAVATDAPAIMVGRLRKSLMGPLLDAGRDAEALEGRDVLREARGELRRVKGSEAQYKRGLKGLPEEQVRALLLDHRRGFLDAMSRYYEAFLSVGRDADAETIRAAIADFDESWYTGLALARAAVRADRVTADHVELARVAHEANAGNDAAVAATYIDALMATGKDDQARAIAKRALASADLRGDRTRITRALGGG